MGLNAQANNSNSKGGMLSLMVVLAIVLTKGYALLLIVLYYLIYKVMQDATRYKKDIQNELLFDKLIKEYKNKTDEVKPKWNIKN